MASHIKLVDETFNEININISPERAEKTIIGSIIIYKCVVKHLLFNITF